jgi:hypothetical protein
MLQGTTTSGSRSELLGGTHAVSFFLGSCLLCITKSEDKNRAESMRPRINNYLFRSSYSVFRTEKILYHSELSRPSKNRAIALVPSHQESALSKQRHEPTHCSLFNDASKSANQEKSAFSQYSRMHCIHPSIICHQKHPHQSKTFGLI